MTATPERTATTATTAAAGPPLERTPTLDECGIGLHYLWHLQMIGVIGNAPPTGDSTRVAIIDNGCARSHPNLDSDLIKDRADFAYDWAGAAYADWLQQSADDKDGKGRRAKETPDAFFKQIGLSPDDFKTVDKWAKKTLPKLPKGKSYSSKDRLTRSVRNILGEWNPDFPLLQDPSARFSNHGTSCAGLIAGHAPHRRPKPDPTKPCPPPDERSNPWAINYFGVNPGATIIPINTPYNHEYVPLTLALLHAFRKGATVILFPRAAMDMERFPDADAKDPRFTRFAHDPYLQLDKAIFELVLGAVSAMIPVVVSAGNDGGAALQYPARLVADKCQHLIVVGACNARGFRSSYSSGTAETVTLYAPSDDAEEISKRHYRYNETWWRGRQLPLSKGKDQKGIEGPLAETDNRFSPYGILAIDIPGTFGAGGSAHEDELEYDDPGAPHTQANNPTGDPPCSDEYKPGSLYSIFGGTSAAAAIVAGIASRVQGMLPEGRDLSGAEMKGLLLRHTKPSEAASGAGQGAIGDLCVPIPDWPAISAELEDMPPGPAA